MIDPAAVRKDFPIFAREMRGKPLVYLDTAASAQKPQIVIDAIAEFYANHYANIHRGVYELSATATRLFEEAREKVARFIGATDPHEVIFVRNATEAINLAAWSYGRANVGAGDNVVVTALEHHADFVPWQQLCLEKGAELRVVPIDDTGALDLDAYADLLSDRTKIVASAHVSNAIGTLVPVAELTRIANERGIPVLLDGAQAVPRFPVDVHELGAAFYAFSGHKLYGPSGTGALWVRGDLLDAMPPYQTGGGMIELVSVERTTFAPPPERFEAGTPDIAGAYGLGAAIDYLEGLGMANVERHESSLLDYGTKRLEEIPEVRIIGTAREKTGVLSFVVDGVHPHDVGTILDGEGVAVRAGHHCAQPLMQRFGVPATARASLGVYNDASDLDALAAAIRTCVEMFS